MKRFEVTKAVTSASCDGRDHPPVADVRRSRPRAPAAARTSAGRRSRRRCSRKPCSRSNSSSRMVPAVWAGDREDAERASSSPPVVPTRPMASLKTASGRSSASLSFMPMSATPARTANTTTAGHHVVGEGVEGVRAGM